MRTAIVGTVIATLTWAPAPSWAQEDLAPTLSEEEQEDSEHLVRLKAALVGLGSASQSADLKRYLDYLGRHFEEARPLLKHAIRRGTPRVRALVVKLYGDHGNVKDDLGTVTGRLNDRSTTVRMAAVAAVRRLGQEGAPALLRRIEREPEPGIRTMAIRALKKWKDPSIIPDLARLLADEHHPNVRKHLVRALEWLSGEDYGDDTEAWLALADKYTLRESERRVLEYSRSLHHPTSREGSGKTEK